MKPPVYSIIDFKVRGDSVGAARSHMRKVEKKVRTDAGCLQYHFLQDQEDPTVFTGYGIFATSRDLDHHFAAMRDSSQNDPGLRDMIDPERPITIRTFDRL